ncbi:MAG: gas vesicle protein [Opitutaceae bacterium]|jgi:hypothetical protein
MTTQRHIEHSTSGATLADLLERILDKGIVIAGDIKVKIADIELLTIQIRLVVCSVDKAKEIGIDWWENNPAFSSRHQQALLPEADSMAKFAERLTRLEASVAVPAGGAKAS